MEEDVEIVIIHKSWSLVVLSQWSVALWQRLEAQNAGWGLYLNGSQCAFSPHHSRHGGLRIQRRKMAHFGCSKFLDKVIFFVPGKLPYSAQLAW